MSAILPMNTKLPGVKEGSPVDVTFSYQLTEANAYLVSIKIISSTPNETITVQGPRFFGSYTNMFDLGTDALKYRLKTGEIKSASKWEDLPDPKTADLFYWRAPTVLQKNHTYVVELIYEVPPPPPVPPETTPGKPTRYTLTKTYTQLAFGDWSVWANLLRDYVNRGR